MSKILTVKFNFLLQFKTVSFNILRNLRLVGSLSFKIIVGTIGFHLNEIHLCKSCILVVLEMLLIFLWWYEVNQMKSIWLYIVINDLPNHMEIKTFWRFVEIQHTAKELVKISESSWDDSFIFTSFFAVCCIFNKSQEVFISIWFRTAVITLSNNMLLIWFISHTDEKMKKFRKAQKKNFAFYEVSRRFLRIIQISITC